MKVGAVRGGGTPGGRRWPDARGGAYCWKSSKVYLGGRGAPSTPAGRVLFTVDHPHAAEENHRAILAASPRATGASALAGRGRRRRCPFAGRSTTPGWWAGSPIRSAHGHGTSWPTRLAHLVIDGGHGPGPRSAWTTDVWTACAPAGAPSASTTSSRPEGRRPGPPRSSRSTIQRRVRRVARPTHRATARHEVARRRSAAPWSP